MKRVYLVRHGETESNVGNVVQDHTSELSEKGREQARFIAKRLQNINFQNLYSSDYRRADHTALEIAKLSQKTHVQTPMIREMRRPSILVGKSRESTEYKEFLKTTDDNVGDPNWHYSDEENFFDVLKRVKDFMLQLDSLQGDSVIVSHTRFIKMMTLYVIMNRQLTPQIWQISMNSIIASNTGVTVLEYNEDKNMWQVLTFNDHAHFAE